MELDGEGVQTNRTMVNEYIHHTGRPWPNFIALLNGKQIFVLTVAEKIAKVQVYFTG